MLMAITKAIHWGYENELRLLLPNENGKQHFKRSALKSIIFGCRTQEKDIVEIKEIIENTGGYSNVEYKRACISRNSFALTFEKV